MIHALRCSTVLSSVNHLPAELSNGGSVYSVFIYFIFPDSDRSIKALEKKAKDTAERVVEELQLFYAKLNK